ncbi:hypothetical protein [Streptomyces sp. NPDC002156]
MAGLGEVPRPPARRGPRLGTHIRFAVNRGLAVVLTGHVEGDVIQHTEIFFPLRALDLPVGHIVAVLEEMEIFERSKRVRRAATAPP